MIHTGWAGMVHKQGMSCAHSLVVMSGKNSDEDVSDCCGGINITLCNEEAIFPFLFSQLSYYCLSVVGL